MAWVKANLNDHIRVRLSEEGRANIMKFAPWLEIPKNGVWETQIWVLMEALGADIHIGLGGPFVVNDFEIEVKS